MNPLPLFPVDVGPLAHAGDPATSHEAAEKMRRSVRLGQDQALLVSLIREHPGSTIPELARPLAAADPLDRGFEHHRQRLGRRASEIHRVCRCGHRLTVHRIPEGGMESCTRCRCETFRPGFIEPRGVRDGCQMWWPVEGA